MQHSPGRDGTSPMVAEIFSDPAFAGFKAQGAAFVVVHPESATVAWANAAAAAYWAAPDPAVLAEALFGPGGQGGGWLDGLTRGIVAGRAPRLVRGGLGRGFRMRARTALGVAVATEAGLSLGFAVPDASGAAESHAPWNAAAWEVAPDESAPEAVDIDSDPVPEAGAAADTGASLARRSQVAVLRDRLNLALDGAATLRLLWRTDADGLLSQVDPVTVSRLGAPLQAGRGTLPDLLAARDPAGAERLRAAMAARATWSGVTVDLPVADGAARVPLALSGSPVFGPERRFAGFRGFGTLDLGQLDLAAPVPSSARDASPDLSDRPEPDTGSSAVEAGTSPADPLPVPDGVAEASAPAATPVPAANVVHLRAFQALLSGRSAAVEVPPSDEVAPKPVGAAEVPSSEAPLSDELAFQALGEALRARIGAPVRPEVAATPAEEQPVATPPAPKPDAAAEPSSAELPAAEVPAPAELVAQLPWPIVVTVDGRPVFANGAGATRLGYRDIDEMVAVAEPLVPAEADPSGAAKAPALRDARQAAMAWAGRPAVLWLLAETPEAPARLDPTPPSSGPAADEARAGELLDRVDDAVALLDGNGLVRRLNRQGEIWFGQEAALGQVFTQLLAAQSRPLALTLLGEVRQQRDGLGRPPPSRDVVARTGEEPGTPMVLTLGRLGDAGFYLTLRDVTALKRAETERDRTARAQAREAGRVAGLLGKVSHEIRTPLNAILGFAEVMMDERFGPLGNPRYRDYLKDIHASGTQVVALVEDLLDLSRIEAGQLDLAVAAVDVNRIVAETVAQMQPEAHRERVIMRTSLGGRIPSVLADERSARQIVRNLLSNAVKFNEPGGQVIVSTALSDSGTVLLRVRDTGVGMTDDEIAAAMEPFGSAAAPHPANGNGLGLPLTRALVGANGASMAIRSRPREGTLVEVAFPSAGTGVEARRPA